MENLQNKIALITGGGQGFGEATARALAKEGVTVILADIQEGKVVQVANDIKTKGGKAEGVKLNVTKAEEIDSVVDEVIKQYGTIDILVNNAGIDYTKPIEEFTIEEFDNELGVNLRGPFLMCRKVVPFMYKKKKGNIINIGSTAAVTAWEYTTAYNATKWGLRGLSYGLFTEAKWHNVKVTFMIPGGMDTAHNTKRNPNMDWSWLQPPETVAQAMISILKLPGVVTVPEMMVVPLAEWSLFPTSDKINKQLYKGGFLPSNEKEK